MPMIDVEDSIVIDCPIGEVFDFVADQTNAPRWQNGLEQVRRITDGPPGWEPNMLSSASFWVGDWT